MAKTSLTAPAHLARGVISVVIGMFTSWPISADNPRLGGLDKHNFGMLRRLLAARLYWLPNSLSTITLISNFGTFLLYMTIASWPSWHSKNTTASNGFKHFVVPIFGLLANLGLHDFYLVGPFTVSGHELAMNLTSRWFRRGLGHLRHHLLQIKELAKARPAHDSYRETCIKLKVRKDNAQPGHRGWWPGFISTRCGDNIHLTYSLSLTKSQVNLGQPRK